MSKSEIGIGSSANDGTGDPLRTAGTKINTNFTEVYTLLGDGSDLTSDVVTLNTAVQTLSNKTLSSPQVSTSIIPSASDAASLGSATNEFSDLYLADEAVVYFGDDQDVTLTHVADTGLLLNTTMQLQFYDSSQYINAPSATVLDINATDEVEINATLMDVNANLDVSGTYQGGGLMTTGGNVVIPDAGTIGAASSTSAMTIASTGIVTFVDDILIKNDGTIGSAGAAAAMTIASDGIVTFVDDIKIKDGGTIGSSTTANAMTIASDGTVTFLSSTFKEQGLDTLWIPVAAMKPTVSNGCSTHQEVETTAGRPDMQVLDFDTAADEHAQFQISMPKSWDEGTVTFSVYWTSTASDTDGVAWGLEGVAVSDNDTIDIAYGTAVVVTDDALGAAEDLMVSATSSALTIGGSPAAGDICFFRIYRDVSDANDDMTEDARLIGVKIFFTTDASTDA